jgi:hypothetical protein
METKDFNDIQSKIDIVREDMLKRFPGCSYTIVVTMWDDETFKVCCRHGNHDINKLCLSTYYDGKLTYEEDNLPIGWMYMDSEGNEYFRKK